MQEAIPRLRHIPADQRGTCTTERTFLVTTSSALPATPLTRGKPKSARTSSPSRQRRVHHRLRRRLVANKSRSTTSLRYVASMKTLPIPKHARTASYAPSAKAMAAKLIASSTWGICTRRAGNLYKARFRLYRSQILQVNTRWKALDEIYKIYMLLHRSDLNISENFRQTFFAFFGKILQKFVIFEFFSVIFAQILMKFYRNFANILENVEIKFF